MKDDIETNISFVLAIETYPCLYNHSMADYSNRDTQDKAWAEIGSRFDATLPQCKERWKNLRACFTRHLKGNVKSGSSARPKKPYYLAEYLSFLEPFTKSRAQSGNMSILLTSNNNFEQELTDDLFVSDNEQEENNQTNLYTQDQTSSNKVDAPTSSFINPSLKSSIKKRRIGLDDVNKAAHDFFSQKKKTEPIVEDLDLCFLKSLLPDMKSMTPDQKRRFKVGAINLSGSILNEQISSMDDHNQFYSKFTTPHQNTESCVNLVSPPMSSNSSTSQQPLNLAQPFSSSQIYNQELTYDNI